MPGEGPNRQRHRSTTHSYTFPHQQRISSSARIPFVEPSENLDTNLFDFLQPPTFQSAFAGNLCSPFQPNAWETAFPTPHTVAPSQLSSLPVASSPLGLAPNVAVPHFPSYGEDFHHSVLHRPNLIDATPFAFAPTPSNLDIMLEETQAWIEATVRLESPLTAIGPTPRGIPDPSAEPGFLHKPAP